MAMVAKGSGSICRKVVSSTGSMRVSIRSHGPAIYDEHGLPPGLCRATLSEAAADEVVVAMTSGMTGDLQPMEMPSISIEEALRRLRR